jgi:hypothetical protein
MNETTNVVRFRQPDAIDDPLTDILRAGAHRLLAQAIEIEAEVAIDDDSGGPMQPFSRPT